MGVSSWIVAIGHGSAANIQLQDSSFVPLLEQYNYATVLFIPSLRCERDGAFARLCPVVYTFVDVSCIVSADQLLVP